MTGPDASFPCDGRDEVDGLFDAARQSAARSRGGTRPDWQAVWAEARRRRIRRVAMAVSAGSLAAAAVTALFLAPFRSAPPSAAVPEGVERLAACAAAGPQEYRFLLPSPRVRVVAEPEASLQVLSPRELSLTAGTVWVHVDGRSGRIPFDVVTPDVRVSVEGTRFAVSAGRDSGTTVAVLDGLVRARVADREVVIAADGEWRSGLPAPARLSPTRRASLELFFPGGDKAAPGGASASPLRGSVGPGAAADVPAVGDESHVAVTPDLPVVAPADGGGRPAAGRGDMDSGTAKSSANIADDYFRRAERAMAAGLVEEAIDLLRQAADVAPGSSLSGIALMELAAQARRLGRPELAGSACERYLAEQPAGEFRGEARITLCRLHSEAGRIDEMRRCYAAYLAEQPGGSYAAEAARGLDVDAREDAVR